MRNKRRKLSAYDRKFAAENVFHNLVRTPQFRHSTRIAAYWSVAGELDPEPIRKEALVRKKEIFLPTLCKLRNRHMFFLPWKETAATNLGRYGIPEPRLVLSQITPLWTMDLVLLPLVAFDNSGNRVGMGGGYYDQALANMGGRRPLLIGLGYEFQRVDKISVQPWDIPLDAIVTERRFQLIR